MKIGIAPDSLIGFDKNTAYQIEFERYSQTVRSSRTLLTLWMAVVLSISYTLFLENTSNSAVFIWILMVLAGGALREKICARIRRNLSHEVADLTRNEFNLQISSYVSHFLVGAGFWIVAWSGETDLIIAVLMASILHAAGSTLFQSSHVPSFLIGLSLNLFQGILFFLVFAESHNYAFSISLVCLWLLLFLVGRENNRWIAESIRMRIENREVVSKLEESRESLQSAYHQALATEQDKNRFLRAASHDLKQPLHALGLYVGMLGARSRDADNIELIDCILQSEQHLRSQITSLLDLSKLDSGVIEISPRSCNLDQLLSEIFVSFRPLAERKSIELELISSDCSVYTDPLLLDRLLRNVIDNAIRYTEQGFVRITLDSSDAIPKVKVQDSGYGIAEDRLPDIFDEYVQLSNVVTTSSQGSTHEGSGIGLAIVKRISEMLGLEIDVSSTLGEGTLFTIFVPDYDINTLKPEETTGSELDTSVSSPRSGNTTRPDLAGMRILIVDDDAQNVDALSRYVRHRNGEVISALDETEIRTILSEGMIDFAIVDDLLGREYTGLDVAKMASPIIRSDRILLISGSATQRRVQRVNGAGFTLLHKPVTQTVLDKEFGQRLFSSTLMQ